MLKRTVALGALLLAMVANAHADQYDKPGFVTKVEGHRLWVFKEGSPELADMQKNGMPEKASIRIGAGPHGMTIKAANEATIDDYLNGTNTTAAPAPAAPAAAAAPVAPAAPATSAQ